MNLETAVLTGTELDNLLNQLEADLDERTPAEMHLQERLNAQVLRADSLESIGRLHTLWMRAGDSEAALAVIDQDGATLLARTSPTMQSELAMRLALFRAQIGQYLNRDDLVLVALERMREAAKGTQHADEYRQWRIFDSLEYRSAEVALATIDLRYALNLRIESRASWRTWDEADRQRRIAWALWRHDRRAEACAAALQAIDALQSAPDDQSVDADDWLRLGDTLAEIVPDSLDRFREPVMSGVANQALPVRREYEVRLARLHARALHARGDLTGALDACAAARYHLASEATDDFVEYELPWLVEAGRLEDAGRRTFFHLYDAELNLWRGAAELIHDRLADPDDRMVWWPLCVARACNTQKTLDAFLSVGASGNRSLQARSPAHARLFADWPASDPKHDPIVTLFERARDMVQERSPNHPWMERLSAVHDNLYRGLGPTETIARLQQARRAEPMPDNRSAFSLFTAVVDQRGLRAALQLPVPDLPSGYWSYAFGVRAQEFGYEELEKLPVEQQAETRTMLRNLVQSVYEQGMGCMERYFESGTGHPFDSCAHLYSMMCNNLGILYDDNGRQAEAIELHRRGIAASPFAEHYSQILTCHVGMEDDEGIVRSAEALWHFAAEHGFSRHDPNSYVWHVARALYLLKRDPEIPTWLERLATWQETENEEDPKALSNVALCSRLQVLSWMSARYRDETALLWEGLKDQVMRSTDWLVFYHAGKVLADIATREEAIACNERSNALNPRDTDFAQRLSGYVDERLVDLSKPPEPVASSKRWWQVWK